MRLLKEAHLLTKHADCTDGVLPAMIGTTSMLRYDVMS
jgi:hypothetical protein